MLQKIKYKIAFIRKLYIIGGDFNSRCLLILKCLHNSYRRIAPNEKPFLCRVRVGAHSATLHFTGTMGEIHTLVDIFSDGNYAPERVPGTSLFSGKPHTMLDLGANIGLATAWYALTYPELAIHAYEPNPAIFGLLQENVAQFPRVTAFQKAIEAIDGTTVFNRSEHTLESSVYAANDSTPISTESSSLDTAIEGIGGTVDIIKMDIEGSEFAALAASKKLGSVRALIGEAHTEQSGHTEEELRELLSSFDTAAIYNPNGDSVFGFYAARTSGL